jgi:CelD/BcsL family acetyltransferase involved in cellulose biosynthesis
VDAHLTRLSDVTPRKKAAWAALAQRAIEPNPFFEPAFVFPLTRHFGLEMMLLTVEHDGEMVVCLPMFSATVTWHGLPLPAWRTWNPLGTPLVDNGDVEAALAGAIAHCATLVGPRLLVLDFLTTDGPVFTGFAAATAGRRPPSRLKESTRPALRRQEDGAYLARTVHGDHRRKLAQKRRTLERLVGGPLRLVDEAGDAEAVKRLVSMEASGWKGKAGTAVACEPRHAVMFAEVCAAFAEQGRLRLLSLQGAGTTLAMRCDLRSGGMAFALRRTYDERFAHGSPGFQLEVDAFAVFHASGDRFFDSCGNHPQDPTFSMWPDCRSLARFVVPLDGR